jgi:hypothetical protein
MAGTLRFSRGSGFAAWAIRRWTRSQFAHVAPCTIESKIYDAFWNTGVTMRAYDALADWAAAVVVPVTPAVSESWLDAQVGKRYDLTALVFCGLCKRFPLWRHIYHIKPGKWTDSRLACEWAGLKSSDLDWSLTPEDVYDILNGTDHSHQTPLQTKRKLGLRRTSSTLSNWCRRNFQPDGH